jgi:Phosphate-selective porin O and P
MNPKTLKSCFGVLCLLVAGTANAAKISFSEKGWVDIGTLIQAQYKITQNGAGDGHDVSNDFLLRRARLMLSGQFNDNIGFIISTDVSYGNTLTGQPTPSTFAANATAWNNTIYLLDALATYKVGKEFMLDAGLMLLPFSHNSLTSGSKYATVNNFPSYFAGGSNRATRDVGVEIRGLLLDDRIYYRLGVFNGVQTSPPGTAAAALINPGDAPRFAGMVRFNIAGKEDGYAFCQVCFATGPIISIGVSSDFQANATRPTAPTGTTTPATALGLQKFWAISADAFADIPFSSNVELSLEALFSKVDNGTNSPTSGWGVSGMVSLRFGIFGPYFQIETFQSDAAYVGYTRTTPTGAVTSNLVGDLTTYRGGFSLYLYQHTYKISAEIAFQDKENAGVVTANPTPGGAPLGTVPANQWVGTLQFQVAM